MEIPDTTAEIFTVVTEMLGPDSGTVLVGGPVRDIVIGQMPKDYDFATPLLPDEVEQRVRAAGKKPFVVGKRFGTIGLTHDGHHIEVTTFRSELYDMQSRKPSVTFTTDLSADLDRRDFTCNAMALLPDGTLVDPHGGQKDIREGRLRAVGAPNHRFREDPLRILRMVRLTARFGFEPDADLRKAAQEMGYTLGRVSRERISAEMDGILVASQAVKGLQLVADLGLLGYTVPLLAVQVKYDQNSPYHRFDLWTHSLKTLAGVEPEIMLRWAALLHDVGKPFVRVDKPDRSSYHHHDLVGAMLVDMQARQLKWSNERREKVTELVRGHMADDSPLRSADNAAK